MNIRGAFLLSHLNKRNYSGRIIVCTNGKDLRKYIETQNIRAVNRYITVLGLCLLVSYGWGQAYVDYNTDVERAYFAVIALDFEEGKVILDSLSTAQPDNLAILHIENYLDFFTLFISEKETDFERLKPNKDKRLKALREADLDSPYADFIEAEIILQWALTRSKFDELLLSARELYKAYKILENAKEAHPDFLLYNKSLSIIHALAETIPDVIKSIIGLSGSIGQGVDEITALIDKVEVDHNWSMFLQESETIYAFIMLYQQNLPEEAWTYYQSSSVAKSDSPVAKFVGVKLAQRSGQNSEALDLLNTIPSDEMDKFAYLHFLKGLCQLRDLNPDADISFEAFIDEFEGRHYIKESYQKLGWYALVIDDNIPQYKSAMAKCQQYGQATIDDDKQALKAAKSDAVPHPDLLRARVLYDGGYYQRAFNYLIVKSHNLYYDDEYKAEYLYRMGRITQMLLNYPDAITYYSELIDDVDYSESFFACNAALQTGIIYEGQGDYAQAKIYFDRCLSMRPDDYQYSLHQKAKSGLNRLKSNN